METPPPRPIMPARIVEALLVLEHTSREDLVAMGADKRLRALAKTTSTKRQAAAFDRSYDSPKRLAAMSRVVRSPLLGYEFCATLVLAWTDAADAAALAGCCGLARVRTRDKLRWWRSERRRIERAGLPELEATMKTLATSARAMCWTLSRLSAMGRDGVAYEHGRRLKVSETLGYAPARVTTATALCRLAEKAEKPLYGPKNWVGCPPKLVRFAANHFSVRHVHCERADVHGWTRHAGSKYWTGVWGLLARHCECTARRGDGDRWVLERFVFPARGEEWVAVARVGVAKRFYSARLELVAQLETASPTHYLKVKPGASRAADRAGAPPPAFEACDAKPAWDTETFQVPATCML